MSDINADPDRRAGQNNLHLKSKSSFADINIGHHVEVSGVVCRASQTCREGSGMEGDSKACSA